MSDLHAYLLRYQDRRPRGAPPNPALHGRDGEILGLVLANGFAGLAQGLSNHRREALWLFQAARVPDRLVSCLAYTAQELDARIPMAIGPNRPSDDRPTLPLTGILQAAGCLPPSRAWTDIAVGLLDEAGMLQPHQRGAPRG